MDFFAEYARLKSEVEGALAAAVPQGLPTALYESMNYSLLGGGKRLRPVLYLAVIEAYSLRPGANDLRAAAAIECIHTYSLIHDDLPAMDDDDFRRGRPTNHKKFGEAMAVLAGDGLLNLAYELLASAAADDARYAAVMGEIAACAGVRGMVGGQALEFATDLATADAATLGQITVLKTGKLIECALAGGCLAAGRAGDAAAWREFAAQFGRAFQLCDDLLDIAGGEYSLARLLGRETAEKELASLCNEAIRTLDAIDCDGAFLRALSKAMLLRESDGL